MAIELEVKSADAAEVKGGGAVVTDDPMVFNIIGSVTGLVDEVNDIIEPGAYTETLRKRRPKIIKDHDWQQRLGKTLQIDELMPGDSRLPKATADGKPWPREAGALVSKVKLFNSVAGREAAERWREYGPEQQYSIGYVVPPGKSTKDAKTGVRRIKSLELFEVSDVLWGAMPLAGPMPAALATKMLPAVESAIEDEDDDGAPPVDIEDLSDDVLAEIPGLLEAPTEAKYDVSPLGTPGGRQNWVDQVGGLPPFMRAIAHALIRNGTSEENAIEIAVATCKRWAAGGGKVTAKTRAKAAAAVAEWERMKAQSHATKSLMEVAVDTFFGWDPELDLNAKATPITLETKGAPRLPGTLEEKRDLIAASVKSRLGGNTTVVGTAEDHVIAARIHVNDEGEPTGVETFKVGYTLRAGLAHLDEPEPVILNLQTADGTLTADDIHLADAIEDAVIAGKALLLPGIEGKAGRVLSGSNAQRIKVAVQTLIAVLKAAGVDLDPKGDDALPAGTQASPFAPATQAQAKGLDLDGLPNPHELVASLRAAARGE